LLIHFISFFSFHLLDSFVIFALLFCYFVISSIKKYKEEKKEICIKKIATAKKKYSSKHEKKGIKEKRK